MKHKLNKFFSLALAFLMLLSLVPSAAFAVDGDDSGSGTGSEEDDLTSMYVTISTVEDIFISPSSNDGHIRFGEADDVESLAFRGSDGVKKTAPKSSVADAIAEACNRALAEQLSGDALKGAGLEYISYVDVKGNQGTLYDGYNTEADTGSGVMGVQKYYYGEASSSNYRISSIRFVPKTSFNGDALISYYGYFSYMSTDDDGKAITRIGSYSGRIYINVGKQEPGIAYSTDGESARFSSDDFSSYSLAVTGRTFKYISFRLPSAAVGTLYYNYIDESIYDYAVAPAQRFYRTTTPTVDRVFFVPAKDYSGDVYIEFNGMDSADTEISGQVLIKVTNYGPEHTQPRAEGPFVYRIEAGRPVRLDAADFSKAVKEKYGQTEEFYYFSLASLPPAESGRLYNDGATGNDHNARTGSNYSNPSDFHFTAAVGYSGVVSVPIVVTAKSGASFDSMLRFVIGGGDARPLRYSVEPERDVKLIADEFSDACYASTGYDVRTVRFDTLPPTAAGSLYYDNNPVTTSRYYEYTKAQLDDVRFLANASFTGETSFTFTAYSYGYTNSQVRTYHGTVTIVSTATVKEPTPIGGSINANTYVTSGIAVSLDIAALGAGAAASLSGTPATISLSRPSDTAGQLCLDFASPSNFGEFSSRQAYPISEVQNRVSFLPKAGFSGTERITYTVRDAKGNSFQGNISFNVTPPTQSVYFNDMSRYPWAIPAVDFFRYYGTTYGTTQSGFGPTAQMKRGDFVLLLSRAFSFPTAWDVTNFDDVASEKYYAAAIANAKALGIVTGSVIRSEEEGSGEQLVFRPDDGITREEAALYLYRALALTQEMAPGGAAYVQRFPDGVNVSPAAAEAMGALVRLGVFQGDSGRLRPGRILSRAETITILYRALT